ncbi:MAG: hypothetical protein JW944_13500 [Deltaproteobacteria bacterium]|nr:hypothetical protein [Deltaproteobacteria bacterium]
MKEDICVICGKPCKIDDEVVNLDKGFIDGQYNRFEPFSDAEELLVCKECFSAKIEPLLMKK